MDQEKQIIIEINSADADELTQLRGVGAKMAERIIEARPFESLDELTRVRGISEKDVERLSPFLTISSMPELAETADDEDVDAETEDAVEDAVEDADELEELDELDGLDELVELDELEELDESGEDIDHVDESIVVADEEAELVEFEEEIETEAVPEELESLEEVPAPKPASQPEPITRGGACGLIFIGGLVTLILAVIITLGVLASINNGQLSYASPYQIAALRSQTESLSVQANTLSEDIAGMRTRIDNLEALSGRVNDVETEVESMQDDVAGLQSDVAAMQTQYDDLTTQIVGIDEQLETLTVQGNRFESFLEGLRALMEGLFPESLEVEETP